MILSPTNLVHDISPLSPRALVVVEDLNVGHPHALVIHDALFHLLDQHLLAVGKGTLELLREALYPPHFVATVVKLRYSPPHFECPKQFPASRTSLMRNCSATDLIVLKTFTFPFPQV